VLIGTSSCRDGLPGPHCLPWTLAVSSIPQPTLARTEAALRCSSSPRLSTRGAFLRLRTHRPPSHHRDNPRPKRCFAEAIAPRERASASPSPNESGTRTRWRRESPVAAAVSVEARPAVITEGPHPNGKIPAPTTPGSPGGNCFAASRCCSASCSPQQESVVRSPVPSDRCFQRIGRILAPAAGSSAPWPITRIQLFDVHRRSGHLPSGAVGSRSRFNRTGSAASTTIQGRCASTKRRTKQRFARFQARLAWPRLSRASPRRMAHPGATPTRVEPGGTTRGGWRGSSGQIGLTTMASMPGCRICPPPPSNSQWSGGVK